jgi:hypothetical protein
VSGQQPAAGPQGAQLTDATTTLPGGTASASGSLNIGGVVTPAQAYQALISAGLSPAAAITLTAIGGAESDWNTESLNNNPGTGDYSVGVWQINYYGDLLAPRTAEFGSPAELLGNLGKQASAAATLYHESGFSPWTTYTRGTYTEYVSQAVAASQ